MTKLWVKPDYHHTWDNRGDVLKDLERYGQAIASYDQVIEISPEHHLLEDICWVERRNPTPALVTLSLTHHTNNYARNEIGC